MARPPMLSEQVQQAIDPDNVPEMLCLGPFNISTVGPIAVLTFTHIRPDADALIRQRTLIGKAVVRARIAIPKDDLATLRDILNALMEREQAGSGNVAPITGGVRH